MKKKRISLRVKWSLFICTVILISLVCTVGFTYFTISGILKKDDLTVNQTNARNAAEQINLELGSYKTSVELLAEMVSNQIDRKDSITSIDSMVQAVQENNHQLVSAYFMDWNTGKLHISPYIDYQKDVRETQTYKDLTAVPSTKWMDVYKDESSGKIMTSIITPVMSQGKMVGAIGYDIDLSTIGDARKRFETGSSNKLAILDAQGVVVTSFLKNTDGKNMLPANSGKVVGVQDIVPINQLKSDFQWVEKVYKNPSTSGTFTWNRTSHNLYTTTIPNLNWKVISFNPQHVFLSKINEINKTSVISIIIGLIIGLICAGFLATQLAKRIKHFREVLSKTAKGDLVTEFAVTSNDEFGDLSRSYNEMLHNMRNLIMKVNGNVHSVNEATMGLKTLAAENSTSVSGVSSAIEEIAAGASNQSQEIENGSSAIYNLGHAIEGLNEQSNAIQTEADSASTMIGLGTQQVEHLETSYHKLESAFEKVTKMVDSLNEKSQSISEVTHTISQIAEQTNLLSLNASIEAARAGEHGKGFAVVANEVRNLAEESKKSTNHIQQIIHSVLVDTKELVIVMDETNQISDKQKEAVTSVSQSITELTDSLEKILHSIKEEMHSINTIQQQKDLVVKMVEELSAVSRQTAAASEEIAASMEEQSTSTNEVAQYTLHLTSLIDELNEAIKQFEIKK